MLWMSTAISPPSSASASSSASSSAFWLPAHLWQSSQRATSVPLGDMVLHITETGPLIDQAALHAKPGPEVTETQYLQIAGDLLCWPAAPQY